MGNKATAASTTEQALKKPDVAILIPCYNEEVTIGKVVSDFRRVLPDATVYVFDNNSTDRTAQIAREKGAVVVKEPRQGKGHVVRAMFTQVDADIYVMVDGDDTYPAEAAVDMVSKVAEGYDMVVGDRLSSTYFEENKRPFHNTGNRMVRAFINWFFHAHVHDIMTGYRAFSYSFAKTYPCLSRGFEIETEMTIYALDKDVRIFEMPIQYRDRPEGSESKLNTVGDGIKVLGTIFSMIRQYKPMPFFNVLGLILALIGVIMLVPVFATYTETGLVPRFPTLFVAMILILLACLLVIAGIILDSHARRDRRDYIIHENMFAHRHRDGE
ncbi:glycosyltransferase [Pseudoscardovia radai]|uniref:glycosyltransferase family 2 protein n=1 Tax=Pseudoscardovia radai TaxID=987066 RepID=UPI00399697C2